MISLRPKKNAAVSDLQRLTDALSQHGYRQPKVSAQPVHLPRAHSATVYLYEGTHIFEPEAPRYGAPRPVIYFDPRRQLVCYKIPWNPGDAASQSIDRVIMDCVKRTVDEFLKYDIHTQCAEAPRDARAASKATERTRLIPGFRRLIDAVFGS